MYKKYSEHKNNNKMLCCRKASTELHCSPGIYIKTYAKTLASDSVIPECFLFI